MLKEFISPGGFYFSGHMPLIYFLYGLSFLVLGIICITHVHHRTRFTFAHYLWLLSLFGLLHGLHEWAEIFIIGYSSLGEAVLFRFEMANLAVLIVSYFFLFQFGAEMVRLFVQQPLLRYLPFACTIAWLLAVMLCPPCTMHSHGGSTFCKEVLARYLLCLPGCIFVSIGLFLQRKQLNIMGSEKVSLNMLGAAIFFVFYGFFSGLITHQCAVGIAPWINYLTFQETLGAPVQLLRTICAFMITIFTGNSLSIFNQEMAVLEQEDRQQRALLEERNRIAMELHDGVQQILFAIGIQAEACVLRGGEDKTSCLEIIKDLAQKGITEIRSTVLDLRQLEHGEETLRDAVLKVAEGIFSPRDEVKVSADFRSGGNYPFEVENLIFRFFQEGLLNIHKHAAASEVEMGLVDSDGSVEMWIRDDGRGIEEGKRDMKLLRKSGKMGLWGMQERLEKAGGTFFLDTPPGGGTLLRAIFTVPDPPSKPATPPGRP